MNPLKTLVLFCTFLLTGTEALAGLEQNPSAVIECLADFEKVMGRKLAGPDIMDRSEAVSLSGGAQDVIWVRIADNVYATFKTTLNGQEIYVREAAWKADFINERDLRAFRNPMGVFQLAASHPYHQAILNTIYMRTISSSLSAQAFFMTNPTTGISGIFFIHKNIPISRAPFLIERLGAFWEGEGERKRLYIPAPDAANEFLRSKGIKNIRLVPHQRIEAEKMDYWRHLARGDVVVSLRDLIHDVAHAMGYLEIAETPTWPRALLLLRKLLIINDTATTLQRKIDAQELLLELTKKLDFYSNRPHLLQELNDAIDEIEKKEVALRPRWTPETFRDAFGERLER